MGRLSLGVLALLLVAVTPAMTGSSTKQHVEEEDFTLSRTASKAELHSDGREGKRRLRGLESGPEPAVELIEEGSSSNAQESDAQDQPESDRNYLNALVQTSTANTANQEANIAFVKTHKTGSTTMGAILYRYAYRHDLKLAQYGGGTTVNLKKFADEVEKGSRERVDVMHYHMSGDGHLSGSWSDSRKNYLRCMRDPDNVNFITVMREPRSHFLSYYYYYVQPDTQQSIEEFFKKHSDHGHQSKRLYNTLSAEFGVTTLTQMEHLIAHELSAFKLIFLTERFDEGLMVLRRLLGWDMIDMTYMYLNKTRAGAKRWDGKPFVANPSFEDLPEKVQKKIDELTELDQLLYTAAQDEYAKLLEPVSDVLEADLEEFQELQNVVSDYLHANDSSKANAMYRKMDVYNKPPPLEPFRVRLLHNLP